MNEDEAERGSDGSDGLAVRLSDLARSLQRQEGSAATLDQVVQTAVALIPGAEEGSILVVTDRSQVRSQAPSSDLALQLDAAQAQTGEGPCLDAAFNQRIVSVPDVATEQRWPNFAAKACEAGAGLMLSFQLWVENNNLGALNLYSTPRKRLQRRV